MNTSVEGIITSCACALLLLTSCSRHEPGGGESTSFATPDEAVNALVLAVEKHDVAALRGLLGPDTDALLSSGDEVSDRAERESFLVRYRASHMLVAGGPDDLVLQVGEDDWPLPIPLVRDAGRWHFDGAAGADELVRRRVGANELRTIDVMRGYVVAQEDYAAEGRDGASAGIYAQRLRSEPGKHNGLYWQVANGEAESPAGPMLADAAAEGYGGVPPTRAPYHGYLYRMLLSQSAAAEDGARDYVVDGKLTEGYALLAYPAEYGASGVMTFMVNQDGVVWQRDLGDDTEKLATAIQQFDPDQNWTPLATEEIDEDDQPVAQRANPASENCVQQGGNLRIERTPEGNEYGVCIFEDNYQCEEWALLRGECRAGGVRITGYVTDAARYCAITGGSYAVTSDAKVTPERGICKLSSGKSCDADEYYAGSCSRA